jgi:hypothetical protein
MKNSSCILPVFLLLFCQVANSTTWITIGNGNWSDSSTWFSGTVPAYTTTDTIIIQDSISFDTDIHLNSGAFMQIDSLGGALCGHHNISVHAGAMLYKYGALSLDTLFINGGIADFILPGPFLMWLTQITNGGSFHFYANSQSCFCSWDACFTPIPIIIPPAVPVIVDEYTMFPNPSNENINLKYSQESESILYFYNVLGQEIFSTALTGTSGIKNYNNNWNPGIYYWEVRSGDTMRRKGKQLILKY